VVGRVEAIVDPSNEHLPDAAVRPSRVARFQSTVDTEATDIGREGVARRVERISIVSVTGEQHLKESTALVEPEVPDEVGKMLFVTVVPTECRQKLAEQP
jgi:hypothetical protein